MAKQLVGRVISIKMQKTAVVEVKRERPHPKYKKVVRSSKPFKVHNEDFELALGDTVRIVETRPISKEKRFRLLEVVKR